MDRRPHIGIGHKTCRTDLLDPKTRRSLALRIRAEEDCGSEDPPESSHQLPILCSTLLHAKRVQHLRCAAESDYATPLLNRKRGEKDWHEPVLPPGQPVSWMPGHLKKKLPISALMG